MNLSHYLFDDNKDGTLISNGRTLICISDSVYMYNSSTTTIGQTDLIILIAMASKVVCSCVVGLPDDARADDFAGSGSQTHRPNYYCQACRH